MKFTPTRPLTIEKVRYGERWFPRVFRHTDGSLLMYIEYGHDTNFAPDFRLQSHDGGATWHTPTDNVPRACLCHSFANGELWEIDTYGIHDPKTAATGVFYGAWTHPGQLQKPLQKELIRVNAPSCKKTPLLSLSGRGYPTHPWWPLWNGLHGTDQLTGKEINLVFLYFTTVLEISGGRMLALGYGEHADPKILKSCVFALESKDRGRNWEEVCVVAHDASTPEGPDEASMTKLRDGRIYVVMRTGSQLVQSWSSDEGRTWTPHEKVRLIDEPNHEPGMAWPIVKTLADGTLVMVYGRPGKNLIFDPTGTGTQWQGRLDLQAWEHETQTIMGVPKDQQLRGRCILGERYWDSGDYLFCVPDGPRSVLVGYDVQQYVESWNAQPFSGVRMLRATLG